MKTGKNKTTIIFVVSLSLCVVGVTKEVAHSNSLKAKMQQIILQFFLKLVLHYAEWTSDVFHPSRIQMEE